MVPLTWYSDGSCHHQRRGLIPDRTRALKAQVSAFMLFVKCFPLLGLTPPFGGAVVPLSAGSPICSLGHVTAYRVGGLRYAYKVAGRAIRLLRFCLKRIALKNCKLPRQCRGTHQGASRLWFGFAFRLRKFMQTSLFPPSTLLPRCKPSRHLPHRIQ